jgi:dipeptidase E
LRIVRLYLSSFRLGDHPHLLLDLAGRGRRTAVVANALDHAPDEVRRAGVERELGALRGLGLDPKEVDLRQPFAARELEDADVVWVRGGNAFVLRRAVADSGVERVLVDRITEDDLVYAGYSAGPVVLAPHLRGVERVDDITVVPDPIWDGLGLLDRPFVPHVDSPGHPETTGCDSLSAELTRAGTAHWALRDGDVLLVRSERPELFARTTTPIQSSSPRS